MNLTERRKQLGLTMKDVADKVGVSEATVSRWESGNIANMRRDKVQALAKILNVSPLFIMGMEESVEIETARDEAKKIIDSMTEEQVKAFIVMHGKK